jgi:beta-glucanase (GH16 family)
MKFEVVRKVAVTLAAGVAALGFAACEPVPEDNTPAPVGWRLVGGDEFNGTSLDGSKWQAYHNTYGDGNNEYACLTPNNVTVSNGTLKIRSKKETVTCPGGKVRNYTSGFIGSRDVGKYYNRFARFEIRARVPHAQGLWPAFWLRHRNGASVAEVDVMEYFHSQVPGKSTGTLHLDGRHNLSKKSTFFEDPGVATSGWHTWAVEISQVTGGVKFDFFVDGNLYHTYTDTQAKWATSAPLEGTWDMAINQAVGGNWGGDPDGVLGELPLVSRCSIGGTYPGGCKTTGINRVDWNTPADATYEVDWVRVYVR